MIIFLVTQGRRGVHISIKFRFVEHYENLETELMQYKYEEDGITFKLSILTPLSVAYRKRVDVI